MVRRTERKVENLEGMCTRMEVSLYMKTRSLPKPLRFRFAGKVSGFWGLGFGFKFRMRGLAFAGQQLFDLPDVSR